MKDERTRRQFIYDVSLLSSSGCAWSVDAMAKSDGWGNSGWKWSFRPGSSWICRRWRPWPGFAAQLSAVGEC